ncbi:MAG TPA: helix-turn-helix domain-containing protein [Acidimicrobiia bacterium]|nr:helix-turn-helix domain-containing protein [Acidimicrobiia bacterium]
MSVSFGDLVRRGREEAGLSQSRLALLIGKSPTTIRAWEHGRTNPADPAAVAAVAAVLGLDEAELLGQAGFEVPAARTRPSARQELNNLASERTEMIALAPFPDAPAHVKPVKPPISEPDLLDSPVSMEPATMEPVVVEPAAEPISEAKVEVKPVTTAPIQIPVTPADIPKPKVRMPRVTATKTREPKPRVIVTQQVAPSPGSIGPSGQVGSNGYVGGRSYLEDEVEKDFYRRRGVITTLVLVFMVIVIWWALGRTGGAIGDLIESIVGLLDI